MILLDRVYQHTKYNYVAHVFQYKSVRGTQRKLGESEVVPLAWLINLEITVK
jgi:hypothetical protein